MIRARGLTALVLSLGLLLGACGDEPRQSILEAKVRVPDDEGVVTKVTRRNITLDGERTHKISVEVESFSSLEDHRVTQILAWQNKYVHLGIDDDEVIWIAGIGLAPPNGAPIIYPGKFVAVEDDRAVFEDGTSLSFARGLKMPRRGASVVADIDPAKHQIVRITPQ